MNSSKRYIRATPVFENKTKKENKQLKNEIKLLTQKLNSLEERFNSQPFSLSQLSPEVNSGMNLSFNKDCMGSFIRNRNSTHSTLRSCSPKREMTDTYHSGILDSSQRVTDIDLEIRESIKELRSKLGNDSFVRQDSNRLMDTNKDLMNELGERMSNKKSSRAVSRTSPSPIKSNIYNKYSNSKLRVKNNKNNNTPNKKSLNTSMLSDCSNVSYRKYDKSAKKCSVSVLHINKAPKYSAKKLVRNSSQSRSKLNKSKLNEDSKISFINESMYSNKKMKRNMSFVNNQHDVVYKSIKITPKKYKPSPRKEKENNISRNSSKDRINLSNLSNRKRKSFNEKYDGSRASKIAREIKQLKLKEEKLNRMFMQELKFDALHKGRSTTNI